MKFEIKSLSETENHIYREAFYSLAMEYLPCSDYDKVRAREKEFAKAYLAVVEEDSDENIADKARDESEKVIGAGEGKINGVVSLNVIGVAFGWNRMLDAPEDRSFCLDGIAVTEKFQKKGIGTELLMGICEAAYFYGCKSVSVGSAGGYVEKFYINAGFKPICYKTYESERIVVEKEFESMEDYLSYERKNPDGFVVLEKVSIE